MKGSWVYLALMYGIEIELNDMPIQKWVAHSILLIGMTLIAIRLLILLWGVFTGKNEGFTLADEAKESLHLAEETKAAIQRGDSA
jgi:C4-dicarboxylate transporter DctQ subunit